MISLAYSRYFNSNPTTHLKSESPKLNSINDFRTRHQPQYEEKRFGEEARCSNTIRIQQKMIENLEAQLEEAKALIKKLQESQT